MVFLQARQNAKASGQTFYDVSVMQALVGTLGSSLPESLRPRVSALSPHQVQRVFKTRRVLSEAPHICLSC